MRKFTIGIPTFNRAGYLRKSLASALAQTLDDVEILVSDNASTDETSDVVHQAGPRVRYLRNTTNVGMWPNFEKLVEAAEGEYFSFLQDDDLIHCDFARRAFEAFSTDKDASVYAAYAVGAPSHTALWFPFLYGPPVALDWSLGTRRYLDGKVIAPLSLFISFAIPPAIAFRRESLCRAMRLCDPACELYNERIILSAAAAEGKVAVEPYVAAIWLAHSQQACKLTGQVDSRAFQSQWLRMANVICPFLESSGEAWKSQLHNALNEVAIPYRREWMQQARGWQGAPPIAYQAAEILKASLNESGVAPNSALKEWARDLTPPFLWRFVRQYMRGS